jgi:carboxyl-terminal processing protease
MIFTGTGIATAAYDYKDYQRDYADAGFADVKYTNAELALELAEAVTALFPDYWKADDPHQAAWDAVGVVANADEAFFTAYMDALVKIQTGAGADDLRVPAYKDRAKSDLIERQVEIAVSLTELDESDIRGNAFLAAIGNNETFYNEITSALMSFTDQYSSFVTAADYYSGQDNASAGIGVQVQDLGTSLLVGVVIPGSGAEEAGIVVGDVITAIDGKPFDTADTAKQPATRGEPGTTVELTVLRADSTVETIPVKRISVAEGKVSATRAAKDTLVIQFQAFELMSDAYRFEKFYDFAAANPEITKLVIDLRSNGGGDSEVLDAMLSVLTEKGTHLYDVVSKSDTIPIISEGKYKGAGVKFDGELFVLTDGGTASAADIVTGTIKNIGGTQVGAPTYGKGIGQSGYILHNGYMGWVTSLVIDLPTFGKYHGKPIQPDVFVSSKTLLFTPNELLPLDVTQPITSNSSAEQIKAYQQRLAASGADMIKITGVLDARTIWLSNAVRYLAGEVPNLTNIIDVKTIAMVEANAKYYGYKAYTSTPSDDALYYCIDYGHTPAVAPAA